MRFLSKERGEGVDLSPDRERVFSAFWRVFDGCSQHWGKRVPDFEWVCSLNTDSAEAIVVGVTGTAE